MTVVRRFAARIATAERVRYTVSTQIPTRWGRFHALGFVRDVVRADGTTCQDTAVALCLGDLGGEAPLLRVHLQCITGEFFASQRCDCHEQLELAMRAIAHEGRGLIIYEPQEGRGIGLMAKLKAYALEDAGLDTEEAHHALGLEVHYSDFALPAAILRALEISSVRLLSNNPEKTRALLKAGVEVVELVPCEAPASADSIAYLRTKRDKLAHSPRLLTADTLT